MGDPTELFTILFLSTEIYGYIGVAVLITLALLTTKQESSLKYVWTIVLGILALSYFNHLTATGYYGLHIVLCVLGVLLCVLSDY